MEKQLSSVSFYENIMMGKFLCIKVLTEVEFVNELSSYMGHSVPRIV
jgi:hypothetical protein